MTGVDAARGRARQAGTWLNPSIGYSGEEIKPGEIIQLGEHGVFFDQQIPLGGKLGLSRQVFEREAEQASSFVDLQRERVLAAVRTRYYEILTTERRVDVLDRLFQLAQEATGISRQLYNVGAADRPDVLDSEIEADRFLMLYRIVSESKGALAAEGDGLIVAYDYREKRKAGLPARVRERIEDLEKKKLE